MKFKHLIPFIFLSTLVLLSCQKEDTKTQEASGGNVSVLPATDLSTCYGQVYFQEYISVGTGTSGLVKMPVEVHFYDLPITDSHKKDIEAGNVVINGISLKQYGAPTTHRYYGDSTGKLISLAEFTMNASGNSSVSPVAFQYNSGSPDFADTSSVPRIVSRVQGIDINLTGIKDADSVIFSFEKSFYETVSKRVTAKGLNSVNIKITAEEIRNLMNSTVEATARINVFKKVLFRVGSKDYLVYSLKVYTKPVLVSYF